MKPQTRDYIGKYILVRKKNGTIEPVKVVSRNNKWMLVTFTGSAALYKFKNSARVSKIFETEQEALEAKLRALRALVNVETTEVLSSEGNSEVHTEQAPEQETQVQTQEKPEGKLVQGVGINDIPGSRRLRSYKSWCSMLTTVYNNKHRERYNINTTLYVHEDWKKYSKFKEWWDSFGDGDFRFSKMPTARIYSADTCTLKKVKAKAPVVPTPAPVMPVEVPVEAPVVPVESIVTPTLSVDKPEKTLGLFARIRKFLFG